MTASDKNWRDLFVGRKEELDWLKERWAKALKGEPQLVVLLAETGLGKTRIAQEFYRWLSREQDAAGDDHLQGYWPDAFGSDRESLDVNPSFDPGAGTKAEIPWLWWGLRWENPGNRNQIDDRCALSTYRSALLPHTQAIEAKKRSREIGKKAVWQLAETATSSVIPWAFALKDLFELGKDYREARKLSESAVLDPGSQKAAHEITLKDLALKDFRIILDPGEKDAPTVPVILLLDDAQWADSTSLAFARELFAEALRKRWKLMVILTHWEQEWNIGPVAIDSKDGSITHARQLPSGLKLAETWQSDCLRIIHPLPEAEEIVRYAFPGLTEAQRRMVVEKSGGNAEMLKEALLWFESEPRFFVRNDRNQPFSEVGEMRLAEREFELMQLIRKRYERLSKKVRRSLGWSSAQGTRFLAEVTRSVSDHLAHGEPGEYYGTLNDLEVIKSLSEAEYPHCWIVFEGDKGRKNLAAFRQKAFWMVARDDLDFEPTERSLVESATLDILLGWLDDGKLDKLPNAERLDALLIARRLLCVKDSDDFKVRRQWSRIMVRIFNEYMTVFQEQQALVVAKEWFDARPADGWSFDDSPFWDQYGMILVMRRNLDLSRCRIFASDLVQKCRSELHLESNRFNMRNLSAALIIEGDIKSLDGDISEATKDYKESRRIRKQIMKRFESDAEMLHDMCVPIIRLGEIYQSDNRMNAARISFEMSRILCQAACESFGGNLSLLNLLCVSLIKLGDIEVSRGRFVNARKLFEESLSVLSANPECNREGRNELGNLSALFERIGKIELIQGEFDSAENCFEKSRNHCLKLLDMYGENPVALRHLSCVTDSIGDASRERRRPENARLAYEQSKVVRQRILDEYGCGIQSLRDMSTSLIKLGDAWYDLGGFESAREVYQAGLVVRRRIVKDWGRSLESLRDLGVALTKLGGMDVKNGFGESAVSLLNEGLSVFQEILDKTEPSFESLRDMSALYDKLGDHYVAESDMSSARIYYEKSRGIREQILKTTDHSGQLQRPLYVSLIKIGDIEFAESNKTSAKTLYGESRGNLLKILDSYMRTPQVLEDLFVVEFKLAELACSESDTQEALQYIASGSERLNALKAQGWVTPLTVTYERAADEMQQYVRQGNCEPHIPVLWIKCH